MKTWLLFFIWMPLAAYTQSGTPFTIVATDRSHPVFRHLSYQADTLARPLADVLSRPFLPQLSTDLYAKPAMFFWTRLEVSNQTQSSQFVLTIDQWSEAILYYQEGGQWREMVSGTHVPVAARPLSLHRLLSFPVIILPGETREFIFRTRINKPLLRYYARLYSFLAKVELDEAAHAYRKYNFNQLLVTFIMGVTVVLFLYNLALFFFGRQFTSLILSAYFIAITLIISNVHGIATNFLFPATQAFEMPLALHLAHLNPVIIATFLFAFFKLRKTDWETYLLGAFVCFIVCSWAYSFATHQSFLYFVRRYAEYAVFLTVLVAALYKGKTGAGIVFAALLVTIVTGFYAEFRSVFFKDISFTYPDLPYLLGILVQVVIFSIAASYRVRVLQAGVQELQLQQQRLIQQQNAQLKSQVEEKTQQLKAALQTLQQQKTELEHANLELSQQATSIQDLNQNLELLVAKRTSALQTTMRDLDTFLYRASHDLRRPLMTILGVANLVSREADLLKVQGLVELITRTVGDMDRMLKKLIAISFCYNAEVEKERIKLLPLLQEAVDTIHTAFATERGQIELECDPDEIATNRYLLKVMLESILENSFQYGGIATRVRVLAVQSGGVIRISITDNGAGIDSRSQPTVFEMFSRAHERSTGNGLGLYLVKIGAEKLGGGVQLESAPGQGTSITLSFP
jgi:signal transduction histidine kinase